VLEQVHWGALRRLRYYFPNTYASLTGADLEIRAAFEKAEQERYHSLTRIIQKMRRSGSE